MTEFCFESINWSPFFGHTRSSVFSLSEAAARAGFSWISFDEQLLNAAAAQSQPQSSVRAAVESAGLRTLAIHSLAITGDAERDAATAAPLISAASELGALYLHCGVTTAVNDLVRASTRRVARLARDSGVSMAIEFLPFLPVDSISTARAIVEACEDAQAGLVVDAWHFFHGPDGWIELESLRPEEIAYVQFDDHGPLKSSDLMAETTNRRVFPGQGEFDLERFSQTIGRVGWNGVVGLEHLSEDSRNRDPLEVAIELMKHSKPFWNGHENSPR